jgi:hypothetical protein
MGLLEFIAYAFTLWFLFSHLLVGPIIRNKVAKPLWYAEMAANLFFEQTATA